MVIYGNIHQEGVKLVTKKQLEEKIDHLKHEIFLLDMKDHWDSADFSLSSSLNQELSKYEGMLKNGRYDR